MKGLTALLVLLALSLASTPLVGSQVRTAYASSPPLASFDWTPCVVCAVVGELFFFNGNWSVSVSGPIVAYTWNFGDGTVAKTTTPTVNHDYGIGIPSSGVNVTLTVQDSTGQTGAVRQLIMFQTVPAFTFKPTVTAVGEKVTFDGSGSKSYNPNNPILGYNWDFGDGTTGSGILASHSYSTPGPYRVSLSLSTPAGKPATSRTLKVGNLILQVTFDDVNVTITGSFSLNLTSRTFKASLTVTVVNATTGSPIVSRSFNIAVTFGLNGMAVFVLALPTSSYTLGVNCSADIIGARGCVVSKDPDLDHNGVVDFSDVSTIAFAFGSTPGTARWDPAADLDANGVVDFIDVSIAAFDFNASVYS